MKLKNTIQIATSSALALAAITLSACSEKQKPNETVYENTDEAEASPVADLATNNTKIMGDLATKLEGITDLESAKAALPDLAKSGAKFAKLKLDTWKAGGPEKLRQYMEDNPKMQKQYDDAKEKVSTKMEQLKKDHPAAEALIKTYLDNYFK